MLFLALLLVAVVSSPTPVTLPGLSRQPSFAQYAGYVNVDAASQRNLFYFFAESQRSPSTDPVVLWLTGGRKDAVCSGRVFLRASQRAARRSWQ